MEVRIREYFYKHERTPKVIPSPVDGNRKDANFKWKRGFKNIYADIAKVKVSSNSYTGIEKIYCYYNRITYDDFVKIYLSGGDTFVIISLYEEKEIEDYEFNNIWEVFK